jgi:hypothetical protein
LSNHYDLSSTPDGKAYQFITNKGERYVAYFTEFVLQAPDGKDIVIPSFGFEKQTITSSKGEGYDDRVKATILFIIQEFFEKNPDNGVLYLCYNNDGKARNRHITFGKWFRELDAAYEKFDSPVAYRSAGLYSSLITSKMSERTAQLKTAFYFTIEYWMAE